MAASTASGPAAPSSISTPAAATSAAASASAQQAIRIIIAGGGLGGLTLANALLRHCPQVQVTVLERDGDADARNQGYYLSLKHVAYHALKFAGLHEAVLSFTSKRPPSPFVVIHKQGHLLMELSQPDGMQHPNGVTGIPRSGLRQILLDGLPQGIVRFNSRIASFKQTDTEVTVDLTDGTQLSGSILVGADGRASVVRQQLLGDPLQDSGIAIFGGAVPYSPEMSRLVRGDLFVVGDGCSMFGGVHQALESDPHHLSPGELAMTLAFGFRKPANLQTKDPVAMKAHALSVARADGWHPLLVGMIEAVPPQHCRSLAVLDRPPLSATSKPWPMGRVTLLGDAAHPMTPFQGLGGNTALMDAASLARTIANAPATQSVPDMLKAYEKEMFVRSGKAVQLSSWACSAFHTTGMKAWSRDVLLWTAGCLVMPYRRNIAVAVAATVVGVGAVWSLS